MSGNPYETGLDKNAANYVPLSPLSFLERSAYVYPTRLSVVHGTREFTWAQTYERCRRLPVPWRPAGSARATPLP